MAGRELLKPTLHIEILVKTSTVSPQVSKEICEAVTERLLDTYVGVRVGQEVDGFDGITHEEHLGRVEVADYTGPESKTGTHALKDVQIDVKAYALKGTDPRRTIKQIDDDDAISQARMLALPHVSLHEEWNSLVFEDGLPARLLRYLVRMVGMMSQPGLNLSAFNWNRICLLHGPPGSGKSTLCRAISQKLSIRLGSIFTKSILVEINTNAMLSKYFGESGKQISAMFDRIKTMAEGHGSFVCVLMDEIETIAGSREKAADGTECRDGLRATNQLLTALDRVRNLPNVVILCTSNLVEAIDPAFLDRVDFKQLVPSPSPAAIYNIFRSCLNELIRSSVVDVTALQVNSRKQAGTPSASHKPMTRSSKVKVAVSATPPSSEPWTFVSTPTIPTYSEMVLRRTKDPSSPGARLGALAQKCEGFSGRTLRRLPVLGLAMYTWGGDCSLHDAVCALEAAVEQELNVLKTRKEDSAMTDV